VEWTFKGWKFEVRGVLPVIEGYIWKQDTLKVSALDKN
jgi:hypothetical protein